MIKFSKWNQWSCQLTKNYAIDFGFLYKLKDFKYGLTLFSLDFDSNWYKGDHNPKFEVHFIFCNFVIFDWCLHNVNHVEEESNES